MGGLLGHLLFVAVITAPSPQPATRAALIEELREAKAADLRPVDTNRFADLMFAIEDEYLIERFLNAPRGPFIWFGGFPTGAGPGAGPAYRYSRQTVIATAWSSVSTRRYWELGGSLAFPMLAYGNAYAELSVRRHEYPQEDFYGLGRHSRESDETSYGFRETVVAATAGVTPTWWLNASGSVAHLSPRAGSGRDRSEPSIEALFPDVAAFGRSEQPDYLRIGTRAVVDTTGRPFGAPMGGIYSVSYDRFTDRGSGLSSFDQFELDLRQYLPVFGSTRTLALRAHYISLLPDDGSEVPFYLQPTLGGPDSLRGLANYRLRDRNVLLLQSEYRWEVNAFLRGVVFYEAGSVARRPDDFRLSDFSHDYGAGLRIGFLTTVSLRVEAIFGADDGTVFMFRFGNVF
jgi:outer membrane protein assembly factor BamA